MVREYLCELHGRRFLVEAPDCRLCVAAPKRYPLFDAKKTADLMAQINARIRRAVEDALAKRPKD